MVDATTPGSIRASVSLSCASGLLAAALATACVGRTSNLPSRGAAGERAAVEAPTPRRNEGRLGTWVWRKQAVLDPRERQTLLEFAHEKGVTELYVAVADEYETPEGFAALADLVRRAATSQVELLWVCGDPSWALSAHHARALAVVKWAVRVNTLLQGQALPPIRALQFDVEPYLLPEWRASPEIVAPEYASLLAKIRDATHAAGLELWLDIPFWFPQKVFQDMPLGRLAVRSSDGIVVMAYRNTVAEIADKATSLLHEPEARARSVVVALETSCSEPPATTMCGASGATLDSALDELRVRLGGSDAFAGLAVHHYEVWRDLPPH
jgi:hypothetical protein